MSRISQKISFSIRNKIFFLVLIAFSVMIVAISWQIGEQAKRVSTQTVSKSLAQSSVILNTKIISRFETIRDVAIGLARDGRVLPLVYESESATLQDLSLEFQRALGFNILFFIDASGTILARSDRPEAIGANLAGKGELFDKALTGETSTGIFVSQGKLMQMVVVPVFDNVAQDIIRGTIALAYELSQELAQEINALTASEVGFFVFTRNNQREINGVSSTYNTNLVLGNALAQRLTADNNLWQNIATAGVNFKETQLIIGEEEYLAVTQILGNSTDQPLGFVMVLRSRSELMQPFVAIQRRVLIVGGICLLLASVLAWLFALRLSRPIVELVTVTNSIREGQFDAARRKSIGNDEVGLLYDAVFTMGKSLQEKTELEDYLALVSDELAVNEKINLDAEADGEVTEVSEQAPVVTAKKSKPPLQNIIVDERYKIIEKLGAGAMGTVFLALDIELDEKVAIKMMPKSLIDQHTGINYKEEIRLARQITHRNILRIFDFGAWKNYYYITMEFISGYDLSDLLRIKGAFESNVGVVMAKQICSAMNAAHEQGIIHRDLKPTNMIINRQGVLKIMDFGLAMKVGKQDSGEPSKGNTADTKTMVAGTPRYMAPEQFTDGELDQRTDIYAIGIILYAIFNGKPPFNNKGYEALAKQHFNSPVPEMEGKGAQLSGGLRAIIHKCLAKQPEKRYQTVREILDDLAILA